MKAWESAYYLALEVVFVNCSFIGSKWFSKCCRDGDSNRFAVLVFGFFAAAAFCVRSYSTEEEEWVGSDKPALLRVSILAILIGCWVGRASYKKMTPEAKRDFSSKLGEGDGT